MREQTSISNDDGNHIATCCYADPAVAAAVLRQRPTENGNDDRSPWVWVRLANGDLLLGTFPRGSTYEMTEKDKNRP